MSSKAETKVVLKDSIPRKNLCNVFTLIWFIAIGEIMKRMMQSFIIVSARRKETGANVRRTVSNLNL